MNLSNSNSNSSVVVLDASDEQNLTPEIPETQVNSLGSYEVAKMLAQGTMAVVYEGFDTIKKEKVVIKCISSQTVAQKAVETEIRISRRVEHCNIIKLYDVYQCEHLYYLVFEYGGISLLIIWSSTDHFWRRMPEKVSSNSAQLYNIYIEIELCIEILN